MNLRTAIDGHWIDICSLVSGIFYATYELATGAAGHRFLSAATGFDVARGAGLFPLIVLSGAVLSSKLRDELIQANPLILSLAGVTSLFATLSS